MNQIFNKLFNFFTSYFFQIENKISVVNILLLIYYVHISYTLNFKEIFQEYTVYTQYTFEKTTACIIFQRCGNPPIIEEAPPKIKNLSPQIENLPSSANEREEITFKKGGAPLKGIWR